MLKLTAKPELAVALPAAGSLCAAVLRTRPRGALLAAAVLGVAGFGMLFGEPAAVHDAIHGPYPARPGPACYQCPVWRVTCAGIDPEVSDAAADAIESGG